MFKFVALLLSLVHLLAKREESKQAEKQKQFKKKQAAKAKVLNEQSAIARAKAHAYSSQAATASADAILGSNSINEAQRVAGTLRNQLDYVLGK